MLNKRKKLMSLIFNSGRVMKDRFHNENGGSLSIIHIETMRFIDEMFSPSMKDVSRHLLITPASASSLIDGLVEEGFLTRFEEKEDRRIVRIQLAKKGKELLEKEMRKMNKRMEEMFSRLSEDEVEALIKILEKFINN